MKTRETQCLVSRSEQGKRRGQDFQRPNSGEAKTQKDWKLKDWDGIAAS